MRLYLLSFIFIVIFSPCVYSQNLENIKEPKEEDQLFIIKADKTDYDETRGYVSASGNVFLISGETITEADNIFYDLNNEILKIEKSFKIRNSRKEINKPEEYIKGVSLNYDIRKEEGEAYDIESQIGGIYFEGKNIKFSRKKFGVSSAFFTNCPHKKKHYGMKTRSLQVYLNAGTAVVRGAVLKLGNIPFFYIPSYVYGNVPKSTGLQTVIPEVKNDQVRGVYITEKTGYHSGNLFSGTFNLEWSRNLGWGWGINNSYKINSNIYGDIRLNYTVNSGWESGFKNNFILWKNLSKPKEEKNESNIPSPNFEDKPKKKSKKGIFNKFFISFLPDISKGEAKVAFEVSYSELINFRRISYLPELEFSLNDITIPALDTSIIMKTGIGNIQEEGLLKTRRSFLLFDIKQPLITSKHFNFSISLNYDHYSYGQGNLWKKFAGKMDLGGSSKYVDLSLGYLNMFNNTGASPFNFDRYQVILNDEVYWALALGSDGLKAGINFYYDLNRKGYRYKEYNVMFKLCKWKLKVIWEAVERNIGMSLSLTN